MRKINVSLLPVLGIGLLSGIQFLLVNQLLSGWSLAASISMSIVKGVLFIALVGSLKYE